MLSYLKNYIHSMTFWVRVRALNHPILGRPNFESGKLYEVATKY